MDMLKSEVNNGIVTRLKFVRPHPNADSLLLATVLGNTVVVGKDMKEGELILYFDSNLSLSPQYLKQNNLYTDSELNEDPGKKGYFGKTGRVKARKFQGEISNGFVAPLSTLQFTGVEKKALTEGTEFQDVNGVNICKKFIVITNHVGTGTCRGVKKSPKEEYIGFWKHWDTKQLMRNIQEIPKCNRVYIEEKVHGTSGRTGKVRVKVKNHWLKRLLLHAPSFHYEWKLVSGTRKLNHLKSHISEVRSEIERRISPYLHMGEQVYYEIFGYGGRSQIQNGFTYGCRPGEFRVMLYRVTITTEDGFVYDLPRQQVYRRAEELGLEKPTLLSIFSNVDSSFLEKEVLQMAQGRSHIDLSTLLEGVVVWFEGIDGRWTCLKHKSPEFLLLESKQRDKEIGDVEDVL